MRSFQQILAQLKGVIADHRPGDDLRPPLALPTLDLDGRRLAYVQAGLERGDENPPVVLLHGFGGFFMDWPRIMAPVSRHTKVFAIDLPGWGFSEPNREARNLEDDVAVVERFLKHHGLNRVILCGISYGAGVAWAAASQGLARLKRVILLNPMPPHPLRYLRSPIYRGIFFLSANERVGAMGHKFLNKTQYKLICRENLLNHRLLDSFYLELAYMVIKQPKLPFILGAHAKGAFDVDWNEWEHRLAGVRVPVSILQGQQDKIFSTDSARYLHRLIPTSELIEIDQCGHAMVFDQHRKVSDFIIKSLNRGTANGPLQKTSGT